MTDLLPCPFCGSPAGMSGDANDKHEPSVNIHCSECSAEGGWVGGHNCLDIASKHWNSRMPAPAQRPNMPIAAALARRLCQLFDSGGESQRSVRARHASAIFHLLNSDRPEYLAEQQKCDANPVKYLKDVEWDGLDCACGGGWKIGHASGCPEADTADISSALPSTDERGAT